MPNNEEQDKTKVLYDLEDLARMEEEKNRIFEMEQAPKEETPIEILEERPDMEFFMKPPEEEPKNKKGKKKGPNKIKVWWQKRTKKQKILLITGLVIFIIALAVGIFFLIGSFKK